MIKYLKTIYHKWFFKKNESKGDSNYVIFSIDKKGDFDLEILLHSNELSDAYHLGDLLYGLSNGLYADQMVTILTSIGKDNPQYLNFVNGVILRWHSLISIESLTKTNQSEPIIKPSQFGGPSK